MSVLLSGLENPYAKEDYTLPNKEAKEMAFDAGAKAQLKKVAEWGDSFCITLDHYGSDKRANTRKRECRQCWQALLKEVEKKEKQS